VEQKKSYSEIQEDENLRRNKMLKKIGYEKKAG